MTDLQPPLAPMAPPNLPTYFLAMTAACWAATFVVDLPPLRHALLGAMCALFVAQTLSAALLYMYTRRARRRWLAEVQAQADWLAEQAAVLQSWNTSRGLAAAQECARALNRYGNKN